MKVNDSRSQLSEDVVRYRWRSVITPFYQKNLIKNQGLIFQKVKKKNQKINQAENPNINKKTAK